jgi:uncharacterized membrane protein YfcA
MNTPLLTVLLGSVIGLVLAVTGAGAGVLAVPLLVFVLHLPLQQAAPVALAAVGMASAVGAVLGLREGIVRYRAAALIGAMGIAPLADTTLAGGLCRRAGPGRVAHGAGRSFSRAAHDTRVPARPC